MTHVTCTLTPKNRDQLRNPIRSVIEYGQLFLADGVEHEPAVSAAANANTIAYVE